MQQGAALRAVKIAMNTQVNATQNRIFQKTGLGSNQVKHLPVSSTRPKEMDATARSLFLSDCRTNYLKILAITLLREIEILKEPAAEQKGDAINLQAEVRRFEAELIRSALMVTGGRQRRAARLLGMKVTTLNTKIKRYRIMVNNEKPEPQIAAPSAPVISDYARVAPQIHAASASASEEL